MEVDNERVVHETEVGDEVENVHDLELLERLLLGRETVKTTFLLRILLVMWMIVMMRIMIQRLPIMTTISKSCMIRII